MNVYNEFWSYLFFYVIFHNIRNVMNHAQISIELLVLNVFSLRMNHDLTIIAERRLVVSNS